MFSQAARGRNMNTKKAHPNHNGAVTNHHDQSINPVNFRAKNNKNKQE
jgi:hypothetical protein